LSFKDQRSRSLGTKM